MFHKKCMAQLLVLFIVSSLSFSSHADNSWRNYKWNPSSIPFTLDLGDNVNSDWDAYLTNSSVAWTSSVVLDTNIVDGSTSSDPLTCSTEVGNVQVCNAEYGDNGWLGLAQIYISRGKTITAGIAKLNDTYYKTTFYNTPAWRMMVMCQEIAHTFGLDHQDEIFGNANLGTCMDYTDDPLKGGVSNEYPNQHDYDHLVAIYGASTSDEGDGNTKDCNPRSPKCNPSATATTVWHTEWGLRVSKRGGIETYVKDLGKGNRVITHVTWTLEHVEKERH